MPFPGSLLQMLPAIVQINAAVSASAAPPLFSPVRLLGVGSRLAAYLAFLFLPQILVSPVWDVS